MRYVCACVCARVFQIADDVMSDVVRVRVSKQACLRAHSHGVFLESENPGVLQPALLGATAISIFSGSEKQMSVLLID